MHYNSKGMSIVKNKIQNYSLSVPEKDSIYSSFVFPFVFLNNEKKNNNNVLRYGKVKIYELPVIIHSNYIDYK